jgi:hypothetical protein
MKDFNRVCKDVDWQKMAKSRIAVKNLAVKKPALKYLALFLDALAESAVDVHNVKLSEVYPSAGVVGLIKNVKDQVSKN